MNDLLHMGGDQGDGYWPIRFERMGEAEEKEAETVEDDEEEEEERGRKELQSFMFHPYIQPINPMPPSHPLFASGQTELQTDTKGTHRETVLTAEGFTSGGAACRVYRVVLLQALNFEPCGLHLKLILPISCSLAYLWACTCACEKDR